MNIKHVFSMLTLAVLTAVPASAQFDRAFAGEPEEGRMEKRGERMRDHWMKEPLKDEQVAELETFLKEVDPSRLEKLEQLKEKRPEMYEKVAAKGYHEMKKMQWLKKKDPAAYKKRIEGFRLDGEVRDLAREYRQAGSEKEKAAIRDKMQPKLEQLFDMREEGRVWEIKKLKEKVAELEKTLEERKTNKTKIVEKRLDDMLGKEDELEW